MVLSAPWADCKNKQLFTNMKCNKQPKFVPQKNCKGLTQWAFVPLGVTIKTNNYSPNPLPNTYLYYLKLE